MALLPRGPFRARADGTIEVRLGDEERRVLADVAHGVRDVLLDPEDPSTRRLFPTAHPDDPDAEDEWRSLMGGDLLESRFAALDVLEETVHDDTIDAEQLTAWMQSLNAVRLVLGTRLGVDEDDPPVALDDPDAGAHALYDFLAWLVDGAVRVLSGQLPPPTAP